MSVIDKIKAAQTGDNRLSESVERWGVKVYFPHANARIMDALTRRHPQFFTAPTMGAMVDLIIIAAENEDGSKMFSVEDKTVLMGEPLDLINRLATRMQPQHSVEEVAKN